MGTVGRVVDLRGDMHVNCLNLKRTALAANTAMVIVVESEAGSDNDGDFEIPVVVAAFLTTKNERKSPRRK